MTLEERGAYLTLLLDSWMDCGIEPEIEHVADRLGIDPEDAARLMRGTLGRCFEERNGRLVNPRQERERERLDERSRRLAEAGSKGGKARQATPPPGEAGLKPGLALAKPSEQSLSRAEPELSTSRSRAEPEPAREPPPHADDGPWPVVGTSLLDVPDVLRPDLTAWAAHRREKGSPLTRSSIAKLVAAGVADPVAFHRRVEASIESGTTVLLPDKGAATNGRSRPHSSQDAFRANLADLERHIAEAFPDAPTPRLTQ